MATVDLGKISEDWNGDGVLNTEDVPVAGLAQGNGILDDGEDVGIESPKGKLTAVIDFKNGSTP